VTVTSKRWILSQRPASAPSPSDLEFTEAGLPDPKPGEFLARTVYLSLDPAQRISMSDRTQYAPPVEVGSVMRGFSLSQIVVSRNPNFSAGDFIRAAGGWQDYWIGSDGVKLDTRIGSLEDHMSLLGITGATAYFCLLEAGQPKAGETVVVSSAAGAVGSLAGQIAKLKGCRVVGIAGSNEKCLHVVNALGFDACVNYKSPTFSADLTEACPGGIDVNFENVGGAVLDTVLPMMNLHGRIAICGLISTYNEEGPVRGPLNFDLTLMRRLVIRGFLIGDYWPRMNEAAQALSSWRADGRIHNSVHVIDGGISYALEAITVLFQGGNFGKVLLKVSEPA